MYMSVKHRSINSEATEIIRNKNEYMAIIMKYHICISPIYNNMIAPIKCKYIVL